MQWWQQSVVYEIVLISFQDRDGDGKGDLSIGLRADEGLLITLP